MPIRFIGTFCRWSLFRSFREFNFVIIRSIRVLLRNRFAILINDGFTHFIYKANGIECRCCTGKYSLCPSHSRNRLYFFKYVPISVIIAPARKRPLTTFVIGIHCGNTIVFRNLSVFHIHTTDIIVVFIIVIDCIGYDRSIDDCMVIHIACSHSFFCQLRIPATKYIIILFITHSIGEIKLINGASIDNLFTLSKSSTVYQGFSIVEPYYVAGLIQASNIIQFQGSLAFHIAPNESRCMRERNRSIDSVPPFFFKFVAIHRSCSPVLTATKVLRDSAAICIEYGRHAKIMRSTFIIILDSIALRKVYRFIVHSKRHSNTKPTY